MKILVVREPDIFSTILIENNYSVINLPTIQTLPLDDLSDFEKTLAEIENYDGIFLTSRRASRILAEKMRQQNINFYGKVYVLGKRSFEILQSENLNLIFDESANTAREMLEKIALKDLRYKHFLFICGEKSLRVVPDFLAKFAAVDEAIVYKTRKIKIENVKIKTICKKLKKGEIAAACFFSPSGAESFLEQFDAETLHQTIIATIGKTTAEFFERQNLSVDFVSSKASAEDFAVKLVNYLSEGI